MRLKRMFSMLVVIFLLVGCNFSKKDPKFIMLNGIRYVMFADEVYVAGYENTPVYVKIEW